MRGPKPVRIELTQKQRSVLEKIIRRETCHQRDMRRAKIVLAAEKGMNNQQVGDFVGTTRDSARLWRGRWHAAEEIISLVKEENADALEKQILTVLSDEPRPGGPVTFSPEQVCQIIAVACESPENSGRPVTHWTPKELASEVIKRGIVENISPRTVGRFLKRSRFKTSSKPVLAEQ
ncbi:helix-turn-helix domain-containing protein [Magnetococcales bacterium HHB-1]